MNCLTTSTRTFTIFIIIVFTSVSIKPLTCKPLADFEHHIVRRGICPYDRFCTNNSECIEQYETNCVCFVGHGGGCICSLAGICITTW